MLWDAVYNLIIFPNFSYTLCEFVIYENHSRYKWEVWTIIQKQDIKH